MILEKKHAENRRKAVIMTKIFILLIVATVRQGVAIETIEFDSLSHCEKAKVTIEQLDRKPQTKIYAHCLEK